MMKFRNVIPKIISENSKVNIIDGSKVSELIYYYQRLDSKLDHG